MENSIRRGDVYDVIFRDSGFGSEMSAHRPYLIVSSEKGIEVSPTLECVPISSKERHGVVYPQLYSLSSHSWAQCGNVSCIAKERLGKYRCTLTEDEMKAVDLGICVGLGLRYLSDEDIETETQAEDEIEEFADLEEEKLSLTAERDMYKRLYEKSLELMVDNKLSCDIAKKQEPPKDDGLLDINTCSFEDLRKLGCPPTMTHHIVDNRPYGSVEDIRRVPNVTEIAYLLLRNKLKCVPVLAPKKWKEEVVEAPEIVSDKINVNTATVKELVAIGMMPSFAANVLALREQLGGFKSIDDLRKVPQMGQYRFDRYSPKLEV